MRSITIVVRKLTTATKGPPPRSTLMAAAMPDHASVAIQRL